MSGDSCWVLLLLPKPPLPRTSSMAVASVVGLGLEVLKEEAPRCSWVLLPLLRLPMPRIGPMAVASLVWLGAEVF